MRVKCPKCGSEIEAERVGRSLKGYCALCGRTVYACSVCGEAFFTQQALAGHMRGHRSAQRPLGGAGRLTAAEGPAERPLNGVLAEVRRLTTAEQIDKRSLSGLLSRLAGEGDPYLALLALVLRVQLEVLEALRAPGGSGQGQAHGEVSGGELPSFVSGNPWVEVLSGKRE